MSRRVWRILSVLVLVALMALAAMPSSVAAVWMDYVDATSGFRISYPQGFVIKPQDVSKLAQFTPTPITSIFFMNPTMAKGDLAGIEPPDLEVRVYPGGAGPCLMLTQPLIATCCSLGGDSLGIPLR